MTSGQQRQYTEEQCISSETVLQLTSISTGQLLATAILRASAVALYTALASPPSTLMLAMPYEGPLPAIPSPESTLYRGL